MCHRFPCTTRASPRFSWPRAPCACPHSATFPQNFAGTPHCCGREGRRSYRAPTNSLSLSPRHHLPTDKHLTKETAQRFFCLPREHARPPEEQGKQPWPKRVGSLSPPWDTRLRCGTACTWVGWQSHWRTSSLLLSASSTLPCEGVDDDESMSQLKPPHRPDSKHSNFPDFFLEQKKTVSRLNNHKCPVNLKIALLRLSISSLFPLSGSEIAQIRTVQSSNRDPIHPRGPRRAAGELF